MSNWTDNDTAAVMDFIRGNGQKSIGYIPVDTTPVTRRLSWLRQWVKSIPLPWGRLYIKLVISLENSSIDKNG